ncbi:Predicted arabinose efflux permease, MFS family [Nannocystis exedens]|uniref:Predicted arabinose efflux permease, MFS family n=1 Tax=Nannocystis exedens TaxID=54 RepID=A0A1I2BBC7_9BACT|nr:MFS transporter [Nannocystis exedens]PCC68127.1 Major Facilitator Superfamily protein [Nannocystis exedens]SFE52450.1 Predicted arabinose efflux permease, MFS family [Nannocystis exedens]
MSASTRSLRGLDLVNVFMADVKDGVGVYLSVYLLAEHAWDPSHIGLVVAIPALVSILAQAPVGGFIDRTPWKRLLLVAASAIVALSCITVVVFPRFAPIVAAQVALGLAQTIFPPCVGAITLGMVGHERLPVRIGRNESFNHAGNLLAAVIASVIGWFISYRGIFYFSIVQCVVLVGATLLIRERDIDHELARAAAEDSAPCGSTRAALGALLADRDIAAFITAMCLWNVANGAMLPLLGQKLGLDDIEHSALALSICIIIAQAVMIAVAPVAARLADRGRKGLFLIAFLLVPVRALLFASLSNRYALIGLQVVDGLGAGIYGVLLVVTMADLGKGTGHFNLLQGTTYAAISFGVALSSILSGYVVRHAGYSAGFGTLAGIGLLATLFFARRVRPGRPDSAAARASSAG